MQELPEQAALQRRLADEGLAGLDSDAKLRFLRVMKKHKYVFDEEGDF
jgi:hypothetical protein